jgi:hypothetical protein
MLSRLSRYHGLPDVVDHDPRHLGRVVVGKDLRPVPDVDGTYEHTLADGDRLDQLAFTYYQQPRKWWRICDANPDFPSPLELVGRGPLRTLRLALGAPDDRSAWAELIGALRAEPGIDRFRFLADPLAVEITYNRYVVGEEALIARVAAKGFRPTEPQTIGRAGKRITIPPDTP